MNCQQSIEANEVIIAYDTYFYFNAFLFPNKILSSPQFIKIKQTSVIYTTTVKSVSYVVVSVLIGCYFSPLAFSQDKKVLGVLLTLQEVVDALSLKSPAAQIERLNYQSEILRFENFKKSYLPSLSFNINPINFNRSFRLLQQPFDGSYSYVEDYSNNSSAGISIRQKIGFTGGELNIGSNINYLREFSHKRNSFSTTPFFISYSQQLWGGGKQDRLERDIEYAKNSLSIKRYCNKLSQIQLQALDLFMATLLAKMEEDFAAQTSLNTDTLLQLGHLKLSGGQITEYDLKQIELQSLNAQYALEEAGMRHIEACERLALFLGLEEIDVAVPMLEMPLALNAETVMYHICENNPFALQHEIQVLEAKRDLLIAKLSNSFNANISLSYGVNQYAETFVDAYSNGNTRQSVVVSLQIPIFQWGTNKNGIKISQNSYEVRNIAQRQQLREFESKVRRSINQYNHSVNLWQTAERAYQLSQENYRMLLHKFSLGRVSVYKLTTSQGEQNNALKRYYSAIRDTYRSYFTLRSLALYDFKENRSLQDVLLYK